MEVHLKLKSIYSLNNDEKGYACSCIDLTDMFIIPALMTIGQARYTGTLYSQFQYFIGPSEIYIVFIIPAFHWISEIYIVFIIPAFHWTSEIYIVFTIPVFYWTSDPVEDSCRRRIVPH